MKGNCVKHISLPVDLIDAYRVSVPSTLGGQTADFSTFLDDAYSPFDAFLGYEGCTATLPPSPVVPTLVDPASITVPTILQPGILAVSSTTALPSATESSVPVRRGHSTEIIIVSVVVSITRLMMALIYFIVIRRYRKKRNQTAFTNQRAMTSNVRLYVDQKAELEDKKRITYELEAQGIKHEMEGEDRISEMPGVESMRLGFASSRQTHELRGVEHSQELEVPGNI